MHRLVFSSEIYTCYRTACTAVSPPQPIPPLPPGPTIKLATHLRPVKRGDTKYVIEFQFIASARRAG